MPVVQSHPRAHLHQWKPSHTLTPTYSCSHKHKIPSRRAVHALLTRLSHMATAWPAAGLHQERAAAALYHTRRIPKSTACNTKPLTKINLTAYWLALPGPPALRNSHGTQWLYWFLNFSSHPAVPWAVKSGPGAGSPVAKHQKILERMYR